MTVQFRHIVMWYLNFFNLYKLIHFTEMYQKRYDTICDTAANRRGGNDQILNLLIW